MVNQRLLLPLDLSNLNPTPPKAGKTTRVRALRDYTANGEEELSFPKDAVMFVVRR